MKNPLTAGRPSSESFALLNAKVKVMRQRQKNMTLSINPKSGEIQVRAPRWVSKREIDRFLQEQQSWVADGLSRLAPAVPLTEGTCIPFMGQTRVIRHAPERSKGVTDDGTYLHVGGDIATLPVRLRKWLVAYARREASMRATFYASVVEKPIARVAVRDMHSRWGSCTATSGRRGVVAATLSFNWRLVLAPLHVLDYVVAHEVAHLIHMNHGADFWKLVEKLMGDYEPAERWLEQHGARLMRIGV
ncbi:MAG: M48 family metallopeptidase [Bdellovibrionales bacterium]